MVGTVATASRPIPVQISLTLSTLNPAAVLSIGPHEAGLEDAGRSDFGGKDSLDLPVLVMAVITTFLPKLDVPRRHRLEPTDSHVAQGSVRVIPDCRLFPTRRGWTHESQLRHATADAGR